MVLHKDINAITLYYADEYNGDSLQAYYEYIINTFEKLLKQYTSSFTISIGVPNVQSDINIDIQYEHTIQYLPGINTLRTPKVYRYEYLESLDLVLDYTVTNLENLKNYPKYSKYVKKCVYMPPLLLTELEESKASRNKDIVLIQGFSPRRSALYERLPGDLKTGYTPSALQKIYNNYKVLINTHQIEEHRSLEELRILPALGAGIIVVSEKSPFIEKLPYHQHIVWTEYADMEATVQNTLLNYEQQRETHLANLQETLKGMQKDLERTLTTKLNHLITKKNL